MELPPPVYESQLQVYEGEVRNHIKVEQQLKLHIEVLSDKIEEMEKEKDSIRIKQVEEQEALVQEKVEEAIREKEMRIQELMREITELNAKITAGKATHVKSNSIDSTKLKTTIPTTNLIQSIKQNYIMLNGNPQFNQAPSQ